MGWTWCAAWWGTRSASSPYAGRTCWRTSAPSTSSVWVSYRPIYTGDELEFLPNWANILSLKSMATGPLNSRRIPNRLRCGWPFAGKWIKVLALRARQYLKIGKSKKMTFSFFPQRHALLTSFDILVVTLEWQTFCQNSSTCYYFLQKKTEFPFFYFPIFGCCRRPQSIDRQCKQKDAGAIGLKRILKNNSVTLHVSLQSAQGLKNKNAWQHCTLLHPQLGVYRTSWEKMCKVRFSWNSFWTESEKYSKWCKKGRVKKVGVRKTMGSKQKLLKVVWAAHKLVLEVESTETQTDERNNLSRPLQRKQLAPGALMHN